MSCWISDTTSYDYQFRFVIVGDSTVGKSSLLKYFICAKFDELAEPTVGVDFFIRTIDVEPGVRIKLQLWDTAGQERFKSITASYFRNCAGVLLVFDITNRSSFSHIPDWMDNCKLHSTFTKTTFLLVGHKADLEASRQVTSREATLFADFHDMLYLETSSVDGCNVDEAFKLLTEQVYVVAVQEKIGENEDEDDDDDECGPIKKGHRESVIQLKSAVESDEDESGTSDGMKRRKKCC